MNQQRSASIRRPYFLYEVCIIAALAGLLFGYDTGVISGAILFIRKDFDLSTGLVEAVVSAVLLGALIGSATGGKISDSWGRKKVLIIAGLVFIGGSLISALAEGPLSLIFSRALLGFAIGVSSCAAPLYLAEISPPDARGKLVSLNQLAITIGIFASYLVCYFLSKDGQWRWMLAAGVFPAAIFLVGLIFLPESPRWLLMKSGGKSEDARRVLEAIRGDTEVAAAEIREINAGLEESQKNQEQWNVLFSDWLRPVLFIVVAMSFFQQTTGINTIIYYAPTVLQMAGFQEAQGAILATLGLGLVNVLATIVALPLIDRWGRRPLLLLGLGGMTLGLVLTGSSFYFNTSEIGAAAAGWMAVASMVLYIVSFAMSMGPICWLLISELIPLRVRGIGSSLATSVNWIFNMIVALTFLTLIQSLGPSGAFMAYAAMSVLALVFVYFLVPETKGRTLEEIEKELRGSSKSVLDSATSIPVSVQNS